MPTISYQLPNQEHTFAIDVVGEKSGQRYQGKFTYKRLNLGEARAARCEKARLMEDLKNLDDETRNLCEMISWLNHGLSVAPPWWMPWDLYDYNVITTVFESVLKIESDFASELDKIGKTVSSKPEEETKPSEDDGLMDFDDETKTE